MFGSTALFDTLPVFNTFDNINKLNDNTHSDDNYNINNKKRRKISFPPFNDHNTHCQYSLPNQYSNYNQKLQDSRKDAKFLLKDNYNENRDSLHLQIMKPITHSKLTQAVNKKLNKLKDQIFPPEYQMVTDYYGNQYYVEIERSDNENYQIDKILRDKINVNDIISRICYKTFRDYQIELSKRCDNIIVTSKTDNIIKEIALPNVIKDFNIINYDIDTDGLDTKYINCIMNIELVKEDFKIREPLNNNYLNFLDYSQMMNDTTQNKKLTKKAKRHGHSHNKKNNHKSRKCFSSYNDTVSSSNDSPQTHVIYHPVLEEVNDEEFNIDSNHILNQNVNYIIDEI